VKTYTPGELIMMGAADTYPLTVKEFLKTKSKDMSSATILAVDPGKTGGWAWRNYDGVVTLRKWTTEDAFLDFVSDGSFSEPYQAVVEDVPVFVSAATSNASSFKLGYNYGYICGVIRANFVPLELIKPREWQKGLSGLKPRMGYTARKRMLKDNAKRLYPKQEGLTNATADALLIMHHYLKKNPHMQ